MFVIWPYQLHNFNCVRLLVSNGDAGRERVGRNMAADGSAGKRAKAGQLHRAACVVLEAVEIGHRKAHWSVT